MRGVSMRGMCVRVSVDPRIRVRACVRAGGRAGGWAGGRAATVSVELLRPQISVRTNSGAARPTDSNSGLGRHDFVPLALALALSLPRSTARRVDRATMPTTSAIMKAKSTLVATWCMQARRWPLKARPTQLHWYPITDGTP